MLKLQHPPAQGLADPAGQVVRSVHPMIQNGPWCYGPNPGGSGSALIRAAMAG